MVRSNVNTIFAIIDRMLKIKVWAKFKLYYINSISANKRKNNGN